MVTDADLDALEAELRKGLVGGMAERSADAIAALRSQVEELERKASQEVKVSDRLRASWQEDTAALAAERDSLRGQVTAQQAQIT